jgi:hypothetical protein
MSWWNTATQAQKLAQIDGGIECGLTARQIAIASGMDEAEAVSVRWFANNHLRSIPHKTRFNSGRRPYPSRKLSVNQRAAYLRGEPVDLWGNAEPQDEFALDTSEEA